MHYFEFAQKAATLYEGAATQSVNTGLDEILEVTKDMNDAATVINVSRVLVKFDLSYISSSVSSGLIPSNAKYYLNLYDAHPQELITSESLYAYPVSQSWDMGMGRYNDSPWTLEGVSWRYRDGFVAGTQWVSQSNDTGGTWFSGSGYAASQSFDHESKDMRMNVTELVDKWLTSTVPNEGFILKRSGNIGNSDSTLDEGNSIKFGNFSFFSRDTHTIYPPKLEVEWDDSKWSTGSLSALSGTDVENLLVYMKGLRPEYKEDSKVRFRVVGRERFPTATYSTTPSNLVVKYLPSGSSYYSVRDAYTEDVIIPFGSGSKVSCDSTGNYFNMWLTGLQPERDYRILFKVVSGSGVEKLDQFFDNNFEFKVVR